MIYLFPFVDKPENVQLSANTTSNKVCAGIVLNLTCTAEANPRVHTYVLYENDVVINNTGSVGTWIRRLQTGGKFAFRCEASNSVEGTGESSDMIFTVNGKLACSRYCSVRTLLYFNHTYVYRRER